VIWAITKGSLLNKVIEQSLAIQIVVVSLSPCWLRPASTAGVYGLVALLVRMDDTGCYLVERSASSEGLTARILKRLGEMLVSALPHVIRLLSVIGTIAMLLVGGGMFVHNIEFVHHALELIPTLAADLLTVI
jgi:predicted DNA repair protein MutK